MASDARVLGISRQVEEATEEAELVGRQVVAFGVLQPGLEQQAIVVTERKRLQAAQFQHGGVELAAERAQVVAQRTLHELAAPRKLRVILGVALEVEAQAGAVLGDRIELACGGAALVAAGAVEDAHAQRAPVVDPVTGIEACVERLAAQLQGAILPEEERLVARVVGRVRQQPPLPRRTQRLQPLVAQVRGLADLGIRHPLRAAVVDFGGA